MGSAEADEDWTGIPDPAERRKMQNRLHQRAWRQRKAASEPTTSEAVRPMGTRRWRLDLSSRRPMATGSPQDKTKTKNKTPTPRPRFAVYRLHPGDASPVPIPPNRRTAQLKSATVANRPVTVPVPVVPVPVSRQETPPSAAQDPPNKPLFAPVMPCEPLTSNDFMAVIFPLSSDHRLLVLIQYNVVRAIMTNIAILGLEHIMPDDCEGVPPDLFLDGPPENIPEQLRPTPLQASAAHEGWMDVFPSGVVRDNLILHREAVDQEAFHDDLLGGIYEGLDDCEKRGMMVWGDPWLVENWEVSEGFVRKWGFLLRGGWDVIEATNRWRESRGEERLVLDGGYPCIYP